MAIRERPRHPGRTRRWLHRWRKSTWVVLGTAAFWLVALGAFLLVWPQGSLNERQALLAGTDRTSDLILLIASASMSVGVATVIWLITMPPSGRRPPR